MTSISSCLGGFQQEAEREESTAFFDQDVFIGEPLEDLPSTRPIAASVKATLFSADPIVRFSDFGLRHPVVMFSYVQSQDTDADLAAANAGWGICNRAI